MKKQKRYSPEIISVNDPDYAAYAGNVIRGGGVVAIPTETYYGLAANPFNERALKKIYKIKRRPEDKPILILIERTEQLSLFVENTPTEYLPLIEKWWPGPLTLVFQALSNVSEILTGNTGTVGIRMTSSMIAKEICRASGSPVTATSANLSGNKPAANVIDIRDAFGDELDLIVDGGVSDVMIGSTIVGLGCNGPYVIRKGILDLEF